MNVDFDDDGRCAVKMETMGWGCLVAAKLPNWFRGGCTGGARGKGGVRVDVNIVCGGGEVSLSVNVDVYDSGRCGCRCGDEGLGVSRGGEGYRTGSEAEATAEQRGGGGGGVDRARLCEASSVAGFFLSSN